MARMSDYTLYKNVWPPSVLSPSPGQNIGPDESFDIKLSPYYSNSGTSQSAIQVQIATDSNFNSIDKDVTESSATDTISIATWSRTEDTYYYVRGRYQDANGVWSNWSYPVQIYIYEIYIAQPTNQSPADSATDIGETPTLSADAFSCVNGTDTHASSDWEVYSDSGLTTLVWSSYDDGSNLESVQVPEGNLSTSSTYYWRCRYAGTTYGDSEWSSATSFDTASSFFDHGPGPGEASLTMDATTDTGYYGVATSAEICDGPTLASDIGLTAGTAFNDSTGWLKFFVGASADCNKDGVDKVVYVAKETLRYDLSWDDIYLAGAVYGTGDNGVANTSGGVDELQDAQVTYGGYTFKVRLLTGSATDPAAEGYGNQSCADDAGAGTEWNDLLYRVHTDVPDCGDATIGMPGGNETTRHGGPQDGTNWATFTNAELQVYYTDAGDGTYSWCQEQGNDTSRRVSRGYSGVAYFLTHPADNTHAYYGWRPVLELIQP